MKKSALIALFAGGFLLTACSKDKLQSLADVSFSTSYQETHELPISSGTATDLPLSPGMSLAVPPLEYRFPTNIDQIAKDRNTSAEKLVSVKIDSMFMTAAAPAGQTLSFIDSIKVYITGDNLPALLVAKKVPVPQGKQTVFLDVPDQNLRTYFMKDSIGLKVEGWVNALPRQGSALTFGNVFRIVGNPLK